MAKCELCTKLSMINHSRCMIHAPCMDTETKIYAPNECKHCVLTVDSKDRDLILLLKKCVSKRSQYDVEFQWFETFESVFGPFLERGDLKKPRKSKQKSKNNSTEDILDSQSSPFTTPPSPLADGTGKGGDNLGKSLPPADSTGKSGSDQGNFLPPADSTGKSGSKQGLLPSPADGTGKREGEQNNVLQSKQGRFPPPANGTGKSGGDYLEQNKRSAVAGELPEAKRFRSESPVSRVSSNPRLIQQGPLDKRVYENISPVGQNTPSSVVSGVSDRVILGQPSTNTLWATTAPISDMVTTGVPSLSEHLGVRTTPSSSFHEQESARGNVPNWNQSFPGLQGNTRSTYSHFSQFQPPYGTAEGQRSQFDGTQYSAIRSAFLQPKVIQQVPYTQDSLGRIPPENPRRFSANQATHQQGYDTGINLGCSGSQVDNSSPRHTSSRRDKAWDKTSPMQMNHKGDRSFQQTPIRLESFNEEYVPSNDPESWSRSHSDGYSPGSCASYSSDREYPPSRESPVLGLSDRNPQLQDCVNPTVAKLARVVKDLQQQLAEVQKEKEIDVKETWIDTRETEVTFEGDRVVVNNITYEFTRREGLPDWICLVKEIDPKNTLTMSAGRIVEVINDVFESQVGPKSRGYQTITAPMGSNAPFQRILKELHGSYKSVFSLKLSDNSTRSKGERSFHKEFTSRNLPVNLRPSDYMGSMAADVYADWAKDEVMDMDKVQEELGLAFPLGIHKADLDKERRTRMEVVRLHTLLAQISQGGQMYPETFTLCMAQINCLLPILGERTKAWYDAKYRCRRAALQMKKVPAALRLLKSNPWTSLLFDFTSADIPETEELKTWGWNKVLMINESTAKAIEKNSNCIDWEKNRLNLYKQKPFRNNRPFHPYMARESQRNTARSEGTSLANRQTRHFRPYNQRHPYTTQSSSAPQNSSQNYHKGHQPYKSKQSRSNHFRSGKENRIPPKDGNKTRK